MDVKEAVATARTYIADIFGAEGNIAHVALEEVERDDRSGQWLVTIGFDRLWGLSGPLSAVIGKPSSTADRVYRVVTVGDNGEVRSVKQRATVGG